MFVLKAIKQAKSQKLIPTDNSENGVPYIVQSTSNNMFARNVNKRWLIDNNEAPVSGNKIVLGVTLPAVSYQPREFGASQVITAEADWLDSKNGNFIAISISKQMYQFSYSRKPGIEIYKRLKIKLPSKNGKIDFDFMESFIADWEQERIQKLELYLSEIGLSNYHLTKQESEALENYTKLDWSTFNLENLFGKSTRGRRLKSADRVAGNLPFVTAGETDEGVSAFIGNNVKVFSANTATIDMFGSAKYRNFRYGGDDHIAVVHTEKLPKNASVFVTSAIHKSSYNGQFNYGRNFYAKDADALDISLPVKDGKPDYKTMDTIISAIHKLAIKNVVLYIEGKLQRTI